MSFLTNSTWVKSKVLSSVQQALDTYVDFDSISASDYSFQMSNWCTEAHIELEPPGGMRLRAAALEGRVIRGVRENRASRRCVCARAHYGQ